MYVFVFDKFILYLEFMLKFLRYLIIFSYIIRFISICICWFFDLYWCEDNYFWKLNFGFWCKYVLLILVNKVVILNMLYNLYEYMKLVLRDKGK